jgi:hypothetical protein
VVQLESVGENFVVNFPGSQFQAKQESINLLIKSGLLGHLRTINLLKTLHVITEKIPDEIRARLEHTPQKSLRRLAQETGISKSPTAKAMKLLKLRPFKATVVGFEVLKAVSTKMAVFWVVAPSSLVEVYQHF